MNVNAEAKLGLEKATLFVEEGIRQILHNELDEAHGVSISPGATAIASLSLLILGRGYEEAQRRAVTWLTQNRHQVGWGKIPNGPPDVEVTRIAQTVLHASSGGLLNKLSLIEQSKQLAELVLTLGRDTVPGLEGPTEAEIRLPEILQEKVLLKLPPYGRPVVVAAALLAASPEQQGIQEGIKLIQENQLPDGSWAEDIIATGLCILALFRYIGRDVCVHRAGTWLVKKQYKNGGWPAFDQLANWAVGWSLTILGGQPGTPSGILGNARQWLSKVGYSDGSFGTTPPLTHPDLDDTAVALMGLPAGSESSIKSIRLLMRLQNDDGSWGTFPTFHSVPPIIESTHPVYIQSLDVTVHILQALLRHGLRSSNPAIQKGINWILTQQKADGQFKSVWFEGGIYGTAQTMELLSMFRFKWNILRLSRQIYQSRQRALNYILSQRNSSGDWGTSVTETALAVSALKLEANHLDKHIFDGAVQSILARQNPQGSFEPVYRGIYAKGWNYEEPIATALTAIQALQRYLIIKR